MNDFKKIRSYKRVWNFERVLHSIYDFALPKVFTFTQIGWFLGTLGVVVLLSNTILLNWLNNYLIKFIVIPVGISWFMCQKTFDGKKPHKFIYSVVNYHLKRKVRFADKPIKFQKKYLDISYTVIERGEL